MTEKPVNAVDFEDSKKPRDIVGGLHGKKLKIRRMMNVMKECITYISLLMFES
jgi:hypothetical protein